ncbi:Transposase, Ptta/En/Spm, partial [Thalictrum thalictroides]
FIILLSSFTLVHVTDSTDFGLKLAILIIMMDKGWLLFKRNTNEYREGVKKFVKLAKLKTRNSKLRCPCIKCRNFCWGSGELVEEHLVIKGMDMTYTTWFWHGEPLQSEKSGEEGDNMKGLPSQDVENKDSNGGSSTDGGLSNEGDPTAVLDSSCKKKIVFNGRGQPIGRNSVSLSTELGNIAKDMVPLNFDDWRTIPKDHKNFYWFTIQEKFIVDEKLGRPYALKEIGKLWRARKSRLRRKIRACKSKMELRALRKKCGVQKSDWKIFVKNMSNRAYKKKSKKFQEMRAKQDLPHTCSRKGYARLEDEMKRECTNPSSITSTDIWVLGHTKRNGEPSNARVARKMKRIREVQDSTTASSSPQTIENDPLAQVLGPDCYGHTRALGSEVASSKLGLTPQQMVIVTQCQEQIASMKQDMDRLTNLVYSQNDLINTLMAKRQGQCVGSGQFTQSLAAFTPTLTNPCPTNFDVSSPIGTVSPYFANPVASIPQVYRSIAKNSKCQLMNWLKPNEIVAFGRWETSDPNVEVHFKSLGVGASKVWIDKVEKRVSLWRLTTDDGMQTLNDVVGSAIVWPTNCILFTEEGMTNGGS